MYVGILIPTSFKLDYYRKGGMIKHLEFYIETEYEVKGNKSLRLFVRVRRKVGTSYLTKEIFEYNVVVLTRSGMTNT